MKKLFYLLLAMMITLSCEKTIVIPTTVVYPVGGGYQAYTLPQNSNGEYGIVFGGYTSPVTKASVSSILGNGYDDFQLFAWNSNSVVVMNPYLVEANASGYDYSNVSGQELKYFERGTSYYNFIGVVPSSNVASFSDDCVTVSDVKAFTADDNRVSGTITADSDDEFLTARKTVNQSSYSQVVTMDFAHENAVMFLQFTSDDANTKLLYYSTVSSSETVITKIVAPVSRFGLVPSGKFDAARVFLTDEVIAEFNSKFSITELNGSTPDYTGPEPWGNIGSTKPKKNVTGEITDNAWTAFYAMLQTLSGFDASVFNVGQFSGANARVLQLKVVGNEIYAFYIQDVTHANAEVTRTEGTSSTVSGIRVFAVENDGTKDVRSQKTVVADALVTLNGTSYVNNQRNDEVITFSLPSNVNVGTGVVASPTTYYALPCDSNIEGYVVKFSYEYKGTKVYDCRVKIDDVFAAGKYYKYTINICGLGNGTTDPGDAEDKKDDVDTTDYEITVTATFDDYSQGVEREIKID